MHVQVTTLKCLHYVFARGVCPCPAARDMIRNLFDMQNQSKFPPVLLCEVLKVLHKVIPLSFFPYCGWIDLKDIAMVFLHSKFLDHFI